jgi:CBS domain containing-hemolysin-like protein
MTDYSGLLWLWVLLAANAFFVASEFAVVAARRSQIEPLADKGRRSAKTALWAMEHVSLILATCQLGITVCSLLILNVSEPAIHYLLEDWLHGVPLSEEAVSAISFGVALVIVTFLHVVLGEMVPKNASFSVPDRAVLLLAGPIVFVARVARPVIFVMNEIANGVLRLFRVEPRDEAASTFTLEEVATIVEHSTAEGTLEDSTGALSAAFEFTTKKARDIALPLERLVTLTIESTVADLEQVVAKHGFSRYVILDEAGEIDGYVHLKDILSSDDESGSMPADARIPAKRIRQLPAMPEDLDLEDALAQLQRLGLHLAQVTNVNGVSMGVLFLEDIIEELVGTVDDATRRRL